LENEPVLVDTSYWIEFFNRPESEEAARVKGLIQADQAFLTGIVLAELLQGTRTVAELAELRAALAAVECVETTPDLYARAGTLGFDLRRGGVTVPITDCTIAAAAETIGGCSLPTGISRVWRPSPTLPYSDHRTVKTDPLWQIPTPTASGRT
jgi:predicted nucleic acid-binding protein